MCVFPAQNYKKHRQSKNVKIDDLPVELFFPNSQRLSVILHPFKVKLTCEDGPTALMLYPEALQPVSIGPHSTQMHARTHTYVRKQPKNNQCLTSLHNCNPFTIMFFLYVCTSNTDAAF